MGPLPEEIAQCCGDHYLLEGEAGRGGMGVVYRAWDQRLDRRVAIKTLRSSGQDGPEDVQRFRREAKTVASLQHPNIASIHTLEEPRPGLLLLVMEWVEGRTLAEHIAAGPPPVDRTIAWFSRIAAALECTHERRVIHRDLKPANVMLTAEGTIKVLDFGLARQAVAAPTQDTAEASTGLVGTPRYMSPEQIEEKPLDSRTDVFSFGSMLYECLAGRPAFDGTTAIELFGGILYREPDWNVLPSGISAPLRRLLEECLHKDRDRRVQDMSTIRGVLEHLMTGAIEPAVAIPPPAPITTFVGRAAELAECRERLPRHRLFTLTGPGGCGKTRLALELARDATSRQVDVVAFADLAPVQDPERVPPAIAAALGIGEDRERDLGMRAAKTLATRSGLLIVDNCEHVIASCAQAVTALLEACPTLSVLATSREPLGITGEQTFPLGSLSLPSGNPEDLAAVADSDAVQLFEERARQVSAGFAMNPGNVGFVVQICRELDGIPLAIELAAARIRVLEPKDVAARLRDRFRLLTGGSRSALPRHRTLWATLQWSYDLLTPTEQLALRAASAFVGAWPFEGLAALLEGVDEFELLDTLTHLVQKSLVTRVAGVDEVRYRLLETTRHFARAHLEQTGERDATMARHAVYVLDLVERAEPELWGVRQSTWLARLETDHEDVMAAIGWCARDGDAAELGLRMAVALRRFWNIRGYIDVGRQALTAALEHTSVEPRPLRGRALDGLANLSLLRGEYASAEEDFERSLAVHRELGDAQGMARAWTGLGHVAVHTGRHERARTCYGESLERCRAIGDRQGVAAGLGNLAGIALVRGEFAAARPLMEQAVELFQEVGNDHSVAIGLHELALIDMKLGEPCAALAHLGRCFEIVQALSAPRATAGALEITAELATALGAAVDAATFFGAAAALRRMAGARLGPEEAQQQDEVIADARRAIDADRFERAWSAGAALSLEEAVLAASRWTRARLEEPPPRSTSG